MHLIVENSGWEIDYGLYDNPISVWGGQSLLSKFRVHRQAMGFKNKAISNLGWQKRGLRPPIASRFFGLIFRNLLTNSIIAHGLFLLSYKTFFETTIPPVLIISLF